MCIGGRLGMELSFAEYALFTEVNGCLLVEVSPNEVPAFEGQFANLPYQKVGSVIHDQTLKINDDKIPVAELIHAFNNPKHL
jgi:hypothetical protein